jgi:hypothetical protein
MADQGFDPNMPGIIEGTVSVAVTDPAPVGPPPQAGNLVLDPTLAFTVTVTITVTGTQRDLFLASADGNWEVQVYAEAFGPGDEELIGSDNLQAPAVNQGTYQVDITVAPGTLPPAGANSSGIYKLTAAVFLKSQAGRGNNILGFTEGPVLQMLP